MATQVLSRVRDVFNVEIPLREFFEAPSVAGMSEYIEEAKRSGEVLLTPPMERVSREGELALSFAQQRLWFLDQLEPGSAFYNIFAPVQLNGRLDLEALKRTFTEIIRRPIAAWYVSSILELKTLSYMYRGYLSPFAYFVLLLSWYYVVLHLWAIETWTALVVSCGIAGLGAGLLLLLFEWKLTRWYAEYRRA